MNYYQLMDLKKNEQALKKVEKSYASRRKDYIFSGFLKMSAGISAIVSGILNEPQGAYFAAGTYAIADAIQNASKLCLRELTDDKNSLEAKLNSSENKEVSK